MRLRKNPNLRILFTPIIFSLFLLTLGSSILGEMFQSPICDNNLCESEENYSTCMADCNPLYLENQNFVYIKDSHFYKNNSRIRFWGSSIAFKPDINKESIGYTFSAFQRYGFNFIRFHIYDNFYINISSVNTREFQDYSLGDNSSSDLIDYIMYSARNNNLHYYLSFDRVAVPIKANDSIICTSCDNPREWENAIDAIGFNYSSLFCKNCSLDYRNFFFKYLWFFDERSKMLHFEYAKNLLNHLNKYSGVKIKDDSNVAFFEITNENNIHRFLLGIIVEGVSLNNLPEYFKNKIKLRWNLWLNQTYGSTKNLVLAWNDSLDNTIDLNSNESLEKFSVEYSPLELNKVNFSYKRANDLMRFVNNLTLSYFKEFESEVRKEGLKVPLLYSTISEASAYLPSAQKSLSQGNIASFSRYLFGYNFSHLKKSDSLYHNPFIFANYGGELNKPVIIYEANIHKPAFYRSTFPIMLAVIASLQDWDALIFHTIHIKNSTSLESKTLNYNGASRGKNISRPLSSSDGFGLDLTGDEVILSSMNAGRIFTNFLISPLENKTILNAGKNATEQFSGSVYWWGKVSGYNSDNILASSFFNLFRINYTSQEDSYFSGVPLKDYLSTISNCQEFLDYLPIINNKLVNYFTFNSSLKDEVTNFSGLCLKNKCPIISSGQVGNSAKFDGFNDYLKINSSENYDFKAITISALIYKNPNMPSYKKIAGKFSSNYSDSSWLLDIGESSKNTARCSFAFPNNILTLYFPENSFPSNKWRAITCSYDGTEIKGYIDGVFVASVYSGMQILNSSVPVYIGASGNSTDTSGTFNGSIDDFRIYKRSLDDYEICQISKRNWSSQKIIENEKMKYDINNGFFLYDSEKLKLFTGFLKNKVYFSEVIVKNISNNQDNHASFILQSLDNLPINKSGNLSLILVSSGENSGLNSFIEKSSNNWWNYTLVDEGFSPINISKPSAIFEISREKYSPSLCEETGFFNQVLSSKICNQINKTLEINLHNNYPPYGNISNAVFNVKIALPDYLSYYNFDSDFYDYFNKTTTENYGCAIKQGMLNNNSYFNNSHLKINNYPLLNDSLTIAFWVRREKAEPWERAISKYYYLNSKNYSGDYQVDFDENNFTRFLINLNNSLAVLSSNSKILPRAWRHLAYVYNGRKMSIYIDGILDNEFLASGKINNSNLPISIGAGLIYGEIPQNNFSGNIDELMIFSKALTSEEILSIYRGTLSFSKGILNLTSSPSGAAIYAYNNSLKRYFLLENSKYTPAMISVNSGENKFLLQKKDCQGKYFNATIYSNEIARYSINLTCSA